MAAKKKRKWEHFKGVLPQYREEDNPERQVLIDEIRSGLADKTNEEIAVLMRDAKYRKDELEAKVSAINLELDAYQILVYRFENSTVQSLRLSTGELIYMKDEPYSKVVDKEANNIWIIENGMDELRSVQWGTLNSIVKQRMDNGESTPAGVEVYLKTQVVMRKS